MKVTSHRPPSSSPSSRCSEPPNPPLGDDTVVLGEAVEWGLKGAFLGAIPLAGGIGIGRGAALARLRHLPEAPCNRVTLAVDNLAGIGLSTLCAVAALKCHSVLPMLLPAVVSGALWAYARPFSSEDGSPNEL